MTELRLLLMAAALIGFSIPASAMPLCSSGKRVTCVVDGDTIWFAGEKIRLLDIDAPEIEGDCLFEREHALRSAQRLQLLLASPFEIERAGLDRYGRTLARLVRDGKNISSIMVVEGYARPWQGKKAKWC